MALPLYLAMTGREIDRYPLPEKLAYMACHFSPYSDGLCDFPEDLPPGSLLILDDRIPVWHHDPQLVARQLARCAEQFGCSGCLLDFQRLENTTARETAIAITQSLGCPVAVTEPYADAVSCGVLLAPDKPNAPVSACVQKWPNRELWLEVALETVRYTLNNKGSHREVIPYQLPDEPFHRHERLCCRYHIAVSRTEAIFTISRTEEDVKELLRQAEHLGFSRAVGLYQQLHGCMPSTVHIDNR